MKPPRLIKALLDKAENLKHEVNALSLALKDPRTPLKARIVGVLTVAYAVSPIDLVPDFIPVLGMLDDLLIVPAGVALTLRLIPPQVMAEARVKVRETGYRPARRLWMAVIIAIIWAAGLFWLGRTIVGLIFPVK